MKHKSWTKPLVSAVFALLLSVSAIGNLCTGFDLPVGSLLTVFVWCGVFAAVSAILLQLPYGGRITLGLAVLTLVIFSRNEALWPQTQTLSYLISIRYRMAYSWPFFGALAAETVDLPLLLWGIPVTLCVNRYFCRGEGLYSLLVTVILPLALCMVIRGTVPDTVYLFLTILCLAILLITDWTRRNMATQQIRLTLRMTVPIVLALALLFGMNPPESYKNNAENLWGKTESWFEDIQDTVESIIDGTPSDAAASHQVDLQYVGPKSNLTYSIMRIHSTRGGALYLRGRDYDVYSGTGWSASTDRWEAFSAGGVAEGKLTITTYGIRDVLYLPYYASKESQLEDGACWNDDNLREYSYFLTRNGSSRHVFPDAEYTRLPSRTLLWATQLVSKITAGATTQEHKIRLIQNYVRDSATYSLSTPRMDSQYSDFAQWFLEESDTGYCVHFATAATVLLRAAGIPARYVEGYLVTCNAREDTEVTNQEAHAWAEYLDADTGVWRILETTPSDTETEPTESTEAPSTTETEPSETQTEPEPTETEPTFTVGDPTDPPTVPEETPENTEDLPDDPGEQGGETEPNPILSWLSTVLQILVAVMIVPLQRVIRVSWKRKQWNRGKPNKKAIARWRQTRQLAGLLKQSYPEDLDALAQKAKFSQHRILLEELQQFEDYRITLLELISSRPWYEKIFYRWIVAVER